MSDIKSNLLINNKNIKYALKKQLEFYFSDSNLAKDKYMQNAINNPTQEVPISVFLEFNRVKEILKDYTLTTEKVCKIISALKASDLVGVSSDKAKLFRKALFNKSGINKKEIDRRTIYIEELPLDITHKQVASLFSRVSAVLNVSIPKSAKSHLGKGYAFIELESVEKASDAIAKFNGMIPEEFTCPGLENYIKVSGPIKPLRILNMEQYEGFKKEYKEIKKELVAMNSPLLLDKRVCSDMEVKKQSFKPI